MDGRNGAGTQRAGADPGYVTSHAECRNGARWAPFLHSGTPMKSPRFPRHEVVAGALLAGDCLGVPAENAQSAAVAAKIA